MFTHPGAGVAFKVGDAKGCAGVVAGGPSVTVAPMLIAVGSTDIVGTTGDTYVPPVAESPDPPARFCGCGASGCARTSTAAVMSALPPSPAAESRVSCFVRMTYLPRPARNRSHRNWPLLFRQMSISGTTVSSSSFLFQRRDVHNHSVRQPFKRTWTAIVRHLIGVTASGQHAVWQARQHYSYNRITTSFYRDRS